MEFMCFVLSLSTLFIAHLVWVVVYVQHSWEKMTSLFVAIQIAYWRNELLADTHDH